MRSADRFPRTIAAAEPEVPVIGSAGLAPVSG